MSPASHSPSLTFEQASELSRRLLANISNVIFGQEDLITETICTFLSAGHVLMTGAPGLAKTTLVRVFANQLNLGFGRIQFTPDLLPSDIIGSEILNIEHSSGRRNFEFMKGPIFTNLLLADEINRASPRTQSAMLESMQEHQVSIGGDVHLLPRPFMVFATQNPFESEGTFPLPEAQLDRFLLHTLVSYPDQDAELRILKAHADNHLVGEQSLDKLTTSLNLEQATVDALIARAKAVPIAGEILTLINSLIRSTRPQEASCPEHLRSQLWYGAGPRAGLSLISASKALALLQGEPEVRWRHVERMAKPVLRHRIRLGMQTDSQVHSEDRIIVELLERLAEGHAKIAKGLG